MVTTGTGGCYYVWKWPVELLKLPLFGVAIALEENLCRKGGGSKKRSLLKMLLHF